MASKKKRITRKSKSKKKAGKKKPTKAFAFIQARLKTNPEASFATIRDAAAKKRIKLAPILYGRVKALMGLVPMSKYGQGKRKAATGSKAPARRGPGRPRKTAVSAGILTEIHEMHREREEMREVLTRIRELLDRVV